mmetsp:Transcript_112346/g.324521  ORF Transcript_112346/g.324521 Transcript_112346/m.324521 type:complete len:225 (+) Transcript_112346:53-727(+)
MASRAPVARVALRAGGLCLPLLLSALALPPGQTPIDYAKEVEDIKACAASSALSAEIILLPKNSEEGVTVPKSVACFMKVVQALAEGGEDDEEPEEAVTIPLQNVNAEALALIVEFAQGKVDQAGPDLDGLTFSEVPRPLSGPLKDEEGVLEEDSKFMDEIAEDLNMLFNLTNAANFVDCPPLLELCTARIAEMLIGKTPQQIRDAFPDAFAEDREEGEAKEEA